MNKFIKNTSNLLLVSFLLITILFSGCSSEELSRGRAKELISPLLPIQLIGNRLITNLIIEERTNYSEINNYENNLKPLEYANLLRTRVMTEQNGNIQKFTSELTPEAEKYILNKKEVKTAHNSNSIKKITALKCNILIGTFEFKEITGIFMKDENSEAVIEYAVVYIATPFNIKDLFWGTINRSDRKSYFTDGATYKYKRIARKFDDGWRLVD